MMPERDQKLETVVNIIKNRIATINNIKYNSQALDCYCDLLKSRKQYGGVKAFLDSDGCLKKIYDTLGYWGMNKRGARLKEFSEFSTTIRGVSSELMAIESAIRSFSYTNRADMLKTLGNAYDNMHLMLTSMRFVSNSKCLHFLFPEVCVPMDGQYTLTTLYGKNAKESKEIYLEIQDFSFDVMCQIKDPVPYIDDKWNTSKSKLVDNAIVLMTRGP
jgi:hypothetical protein